MSNDAFIQLAEDSTFYSIFENGHAPIESPLAKLATMGGLGEQLVYMLDLKRCTIEQKNRVIQTLHARAPCEDVREIDRRLKWH